MGETRPPEESKGTGVSFYSRGGRVGIILSLLLADLKIELPTSSEKIADIWAKSFITGDEQIIVVGEVGKFSGSIDGRASAERKIRYKMEDRRDAIELLFSISVITTEDSALVIYSVLSGKLDEQERKFLHDGLKSAVSMRNN